MLFLQQSYTRIPCSKSWLCFSMTVLLRGCASPWLCCSVAVLLHGCAAPWLCFSTAVLLHGCAAPCLFYFMTVLVHNCSSPWLFYFMAVLFYVCSSPWLFHFMPFSLVAHPEATRSPFQAISKQENSDPLLPYWTYCDSRPDFPSPPPLLYIIYKWQWPLSCSEGLLFNL